MSPESLEKISHPDLDTSKDNQISVMKLGNEQTDRYTIFFEYLVLVYKHPKNVSKKIRKISHPELDISLYLYNFIKPTIRLTDKREI